MDTQSQDFFGSRLQDNKTPTVATGAAYQMTVADQVVLAEIPASGDLIVTLPPVLQARGRLYHIRCDSDLGAGSVDVVGVGAVDYAAADITAAGGYVTVVSTGDMWVEVNSSAT